MLLVADFSYKTKKEGQIFRCTICVQSVYASRYKRKAKRGKKKIGKRAGGMLGPCQSLAKPEAVGMRLK